MTTTTDKQKLKLRAPYGAILLRPHDETPAGIIVVGQSLEYRVGTVLDSGPDVDTVAPGDEVHFYAESAHAFLPDIWFLTEVNILAYSRFVDEVDE
jgi:hypothetical protein